MPRRRETGAAIVAHDLSIEHATGSRPRAGRAVDGASFRVEHGASLVVMGPTGSGKSSLAAMLAGDRRGDLSVVGGEAYVEGISVRRPGRSLRTLTYLAGYHAQRAGAELAPRLTVGEIIAEPITSRDRRVGERALALRVAALLDELKLALGTTTKYPYELSAGMRQRVAFARALVLQPRVLIADSPLSNLDPDVRHVILDAINDRRAAYGMSSLVVTNEPDVAAALDADVMVLQHGHTVAQGHHDRVIWSPAADADARMLVS